MIICGTPKCGSTIFRSALLYASGQKQKHLNNPHGFRGYVPQSQKALHSAMTNYTSLLLVRNPLTRLWSAYKDKCVLRPPERRKKFCKIIGKPTMSRFKPFVEALFNQRHLHATWNSHIRPLSDICALSTFEYDDFIRQEYMVFDTFRLIKHHQLPHGDALIASVQANRR